MNYTMVGWIGTLMSVGLLVMNILIAIGVSQDADRVARSGQTVKIFSPGLWAVVCFFGSIPPLAVYAVLHHTTLAKS